MKLSLRTIPNCGLPAHLAVDTIIGDTMRIQLLYALSMHCLHYIGTNYASLKILNTSWDFSLLNQFII